MSRWLLIACVLAAPASASELEDARDNFETVVRTHVASKSTDGFWVFKRAGGKYMRLQLLGAERGTVHRVQAGRWRGIVDFKDAVTKKTFFADVTVDTASELWDVKALNWLSLKDAASGRAAAEKAAKAGSAPRRPGPFGLLPEVNLTSLDGRETYMPDCATPKCLTVIVAPWCPHCRTVTGVLAAMRDWLPKHGVDMRIVVGDDSEESVRDYAKSFGPATLVDPSSIFKIAGGVPAFLVSTNGGAVIRKENGALEDEKDPVEYAKSLGLP